MKRLLLLTLAVLGLPAHGALSFGDGTTDKVLVTNPLTFGSGTAFTQLWWVRQRSAPSNAQGTGKGGADLFNFYTTFNCEIPRATETAFASVAAANVFSDIAWTFIAITYSEASGIKFYRGTLTTTPAELSYVVNTVGSGATSDNTGALLVGNRSSSAALSPPHDLAFFALYDTEFTLGEIRAHQFSRIKRKDGCRVLFNAGFSGTTTQVDHSGNARNSTITGTTLTAHVPLRP